VSRCVVGRPYEKLIRPELSVDPLLVRTKENRGTNGEEEEEKIKKM
jgi:hypothetical protein